MKTGGEVGDWYSLAINQGNSIYIAYSSSGNHLKLAFYDGENWGTQYIDLDNKVGRYCDMVLDENGIPHVAYYDVNNQRLKYATWSSAERGTEAIEE